MSFSLALYWNTSISLNILPHYNFKYPPSTWLCEYIINYFTNPLCSSSNFKSLAFKSHTRIQVWWHTPGISHLWGLSWMISGCRAALIWERHLSSKPWAAAECRSRAGIMIIFTKIFIRKFPRRGINQRVQCCTSSDKCHPTIFRKKCLLYVFAPYDCVLKLWLLLDFIRKLKKIIVIK